MNARQALASGAGLGAGLMYVLDPSRGRQRRALIRDRAAHLSHRVRHAANVTARDLAHRLNGLAAEHRAGWTTEPVTDDVLTARVRAELGLAVRHPHRISVTAHQGHVTLSGEAQADELYRLWSRLPKVRGIADVEDRLEVYQNGAVGDATEPAPRAGRPELFQERWAPATRLIVSLVGSALTSYSLRRRDPVGSVVGLGLLARALTNLELRRLTGIGAGRRAIDLEKTINIAAPVESVFERWADYEQFPRIMDHVRDVRRMDGARSRWVVDGPCGCPVTWQAVVTQLTPDQVLAWKTEPGSTVAHAGTVRFGRNARGGTRVEIRMSYNPPGGALGHGLALLLGCDPKHLMERDLVRLKSFVERGRTTAHHKEVTGDASVPDPVLMTRDPVWRARSAETGLGADEPLTAMAGKDRESGC